MAASVATTDTPLTTTANHHVQQPEVVCAVYFLLQARRFSTPLIAFLGASKQAGQRHEHKLGRLLYWIAISSAFMIMHTAGLVWCSMILVAQPGAHTPQFGASAVFFTTVSRLGTSFAQVKHV